MYGPHWSAQLDGKLKKQDNKGIHISAKALNIIWGNESRFWKWIELPQNDSEFSCGAELLQVNWIEITGKLDLSQLPSGKCEIIYVVKFKVDAFGWQRSPIKFKLATTDGQVSEKSEILEPYRKVTDKWQEIRGGEFTVNSTNNKGVVYFGMYENETDWWKASMILEGVKIRPKT